MNKEQFTNELHYQITMNIARQMLNKAIISKEEYAKIDTIFLEKHKPILGSLSSK